MAPKRQDASHVPDIEIFTKPPRMVNSSAPYDSKAFAERVRAGAAGLAQRMDRDFAEFENEDQKTEKA